MSQNDTALLIRPAIASDAAQVALLIRAMAVEAGESSPLGPTFARQYLATSGSGVLLAERVGRAVGLLSFSLRPDLYHAAPVCLAEALFVEAGEREHGVGSALVGALLRLAEERGCAEVSAGVVNDAALRRFYARHGLVEESVLLERHLGAGDPL